MKKIIFLMMFFVCGCSYRTMTSHPLPAKPYLDVELIFTSKIWPKCKYQEMSHLVSSSSGSPNSAADELRKMAADIGADFVKITSVKIYYGFFSDNVYMMGVAYSCDERLERKRAPTKL